ncbi:unnamed protein product [Peronospora belbahrii]|uniref:Uncharacterized protein n=1 Tax=Peronospora belbahrii TaxID=622444 RepID=A0ABN8CS85_9STRA|nr:unnamed protein product [Peronospora belbahrii]
MSVKPGVIPVDFSFIFCGIPQTELETRGASSASPFIARFGRRRPTVSHAVTTDTEPNTFEFTTKFLKVRRRSGSFRHLVSPSSSLLQKSHHQNQKRRSRSQSEGLTSDCGTPNLYD